MDETGKVTLFIFSTKNTKEETLYSNDSTGKKWPPLLAA